MLNRSAPRYVSFSRQISNNLVELNSSRSPSTSPEFIERVTPVPDAAVHTYITCFDHYLRCIFYKVQRSRRSLFRQTCHRRDARCRVLLASRDALRIVTTDRKTQGEKKDLEIRSEECAAVASGIHHRCISDGKQWILCKKLSTLASLIYRVLRSSEKQEGRSIRQDYPIFRSEDVGHSERSVNPCDAEK